MISRKTSFIVGLILPGLFAFAALGQTPQQLPEDEVGLEQRISNDVDNYVLSERAFNGNVAALSNDRKLMIDLLRNKVKWYQDRIVSQPCVDWVNQRSTPVAPKNK